MSNEISLRVRQNCKHENFEYHDSDIEDMWCQCGAGKKVEIMICLNCDALGTIDAGIRPCSCNPTIKWETASE
jgi:hypothetical protein